MVYVLYMTSPESFEAADTRRWPSPGWCCLLSVVPVLAYWFSPYNSERGNRMRRRRGAWIEAVSQAFAFFGGTMASFAALAIRNFTTFLAAILMASPVAGLRPMRALRS